MVRISLVFILTLLTSPLYGQDDLRSINVNYITTEISIDGVMNEDAWQTADVAQNFWQFFPTDTARAEHPTQMRMLYDDNTLYVGIRAEVPDDNYMVSTLRRDFSGTDSDNVSVMFDTFRDATNAYLFGVNPYGVKREALITGGGDEGSNFNSTWDEKWRAESQRYDDHYVVEIAIPFAALSYPEGSQRWRFQGYRWDFQTNERSIWSRVPQNQLMINLAFLGEMVFERPLERSNNPVSVIPYLNTGSSNDFMDNESSTDLKMGGDAKMEVSSGMTLDLTANPDFSNVEVDEFITNTTRFEISREEKRQFFIDNGDLFGDFGSSFGDDVPFFSRRIGIARDSTGRLVENRILGGARLSGNLNEDWRLEFLNIQTAENRGLGTPSNNNMMLTVKRKVFSRSNVGAFFINRQTFNDYDFLAPQDKYNRVVGIDYNLASANNIWTGTFYLHKSFQPEDHLGNYSSQATLQYNTRRFRITTDFVFVDQEYRSDLGFIPRKDIFKNGNTVGLTFYPESKLINNHEFRFVTANYWRPTLDFKLTDHLYRGYWTAEFQDQSTFELIFSNNFVYLLNSFDPTGTTGAVPLPGDKGYYFNEVSGSYESDSSNDFYFNIESSFGGFFNGINTSVGGAA